MKPCSFCSWPVAPGDGAAGIHSYCVRYRDKIPPTCSPKPSARVTRRCECGHPASWVVLGTTPRVYLCEECKPAEEASVGKYFLFEPLRKEASE